MYPQKMRERMKKNPASIDENATASAEQSTSERAHAAEIIFHSKPAENQTTKENATMNNAEISKHVKEIRATIRRHKAAGIVRMGDRNLYQTVHPARCYFPEFREIVRSCGMFGGFVTHQGQD